MLSHGACRKTFSTNSVFIAQKDLDFKSGGIIFAQTQGKNHEVSN